MTDDLKMSETVSEPVSKGSGHSAIWVGHNQMPRERVKRWVVWTAVAMPAMAVGSQYGQAGEQNRQV